MTTITDSQAPAAAAPTASGRVARVTGAVVDIEFPPGQIPNLYNALTIEIEDTGSGLEASTLVLETAQHLGDGMVRGVALKPTDGVVRGQAVTDTGAAISVPVGDATLGTVFDVVGNPLNKPGGLLFILTRPKQLAGAGHGLEAALPVMVMPHQLRRSVTERATKGIRIRTSS